MVVLNDLLLKVSRRIILLRTTDLCRSVSALIVAPRSMAPLGVRSSTANTISILRCPQAWATCGRHAHPSAMVSSSVALFHMSFLPLPHLCMTSSHNVPMSIIVALILCSRVMRVPKSWWLMFHWPCEREAKTLTRRVAHMGSLTSTISVCPCATVINKPR